MADLQEVKQILRSLVVSSPLTMDVNSLLQDYRSMLGEPLPSAKYGYRDPVLFLRERCSDCFLFGGPQNNPIVTLIVPDTIKHIDQMVQSQRAPRLAGGRRRSVPESMIKKKQQEQLEAREGSPLPTSSEEPDSSPSRPRAAECISMALSLLRLTPTPEPSPPPAEDLLVRDVAGPSSSLDASPSRSAEIDSPVPELQERCLTPVTPEQ